MFAVDLASKTDLAAIALLFERNNKLVAFGRYYLPQSAIDNARQAAYQGWARKVLS